MNITDTMFLRVDRLGDDPNNLITQEQHILPTNGKIIKPNFLAYYTDSLIVTVKDSSGLQRTLTYLHDYIYTDHFHNLSATVGKQICGSILIDPSIQELDFTISYQAYGCMNHPDIKQIAIAIASRLQTNPIDWESIIDKPKGFTPKPNHLHDWLDLYGLEYIVVALRRIKEAIDKTTRLKNLGLSQKIQQIFASHPINTNVVYIDPSHIEDVLNIHRTTKAHIGLSDVQNLKVFDSYTPYLNNQGTASLFVDFNQSSEIRYITPISAANYIIESIELVKKQLFTNGSSLVASMHFNINTIDTNATQALNVLSNSLQQISLLENSINLTKTKNDELTSFIKKYKHLNQNEELAIILKATSQHKYNSNTSYSSLYDVPSKIPNLYFWIDFSDSSKLILNNTVVQNSISSITDKSSGSRVFTQLNQNNRPILIQNNQLGNSQINKNNSANFSNGNYLAQISGPSITLYNDCTFFTLYKNKNSQNVLLSSNLNSDILKGHFEQRSVSLITDKFNLKSPSNSSVNYTSTLSVLSISNTNLDECWSATNDYYNQVFPLGLEVKSRTSNNSFSFNLIGSVSANQDYELSEILIYNRQLSIKEVDALTKYLSKKWSGSTDFNIPTSFVNNNI